MPLPETLYEAALGASRPALRAASLVNEQVARAVRGRRESLSRFRSWGETGRDRARPLVWFHAPSVGEGLMAQAMIAALRRLRPDVQVAFTHFSPSAERIADRVGADVHGYLPWDTRRAVRQTLSALRPAAIAFVRTEVWPVVTREARSERVRLLLVNAVLAEGSGRLNWAGRRFLEPVYRRLDGVGAVTEAHARRYELLGVPPGAIRITGDARFDQVWARVGAGPVADFRADPSALDRVPESLRSVFRLIRDPERFTLVAGSTWPSDDEVLAPAVVALRRDRPFRLVVAPHEPTPSHLAKLERTLDRRGLRHSRLGALLAAATAEAAGTGGPVTVPDVVVVDRLGILADLYALGDAAYVGGGFHGAGLHSVVEPAALGVPVLFGPGHENAREAAELAAAGGGFEVTGVAALEEAIRRLVPGEARRAAGERARAYVRAGTGAAERNAALIAGSLPRNVTDGSV